MFDAPVGQTCPVTTPPPMRTSLAYERSPAALWALCARRDDRQPPRPAPITGSGPRHAALDKPKGNSVRRVVQLNVRQAARRSTSAVLLACVAAVAARC